MLYLECNCNHNSASCFCAHSPLWGGRGREGKIGTPLHRLFYNMHGISSLSLLAGCYYPKCPRIFSCTMAEWETSQLSSSSSDTESQEERDVHTPRTPIQNVNLSYSSTSSNASPVQTPKTKEINRLREENRRLKEQLEQVLSLQPDRHSEHDDDDVQDGDGRYKDRVEICRDRHDRRSFKICASCVNFPGKQRNFSHNLRRTSRFTHTKCDFALKLVKL